MTEPNGAFTIVAQSTATGSASDALDALDSLKIEWYLTDEGSLMVKSWQVVTEDFVSREEVADLRAEHDVPVPQEAESLEWVAAHLGELQRDHAGQWIAVDRNRVAASAVSLGELMNMPEVVRADEPFITQIPTGPIAWKTLYGQQIV